MGFLNEGDAEKFLVDANLVDEIAGMVLSDKKLACDLADEMADQLEDVIGQDSTFMDKILSAAVDNDNFRQRVVQRVAAKLK